MQLRNLHDEEAELLKGFLYEAILIPEGMEPTDRSIIKVEKADKIKDL